MKPCDLKLAEKLVYPLYIIYQIRLYIIIMYEGYTFQNTVTDHVYVYFKIKQRVMFIF